MGHFPLVPEGLEQSEAIGMILDMLARFDDVDMVLNPQERAVGLIGVRGSDKATEVHAMWFRWASPRDIMEAGVQFLMRHIEEGRWAILYGKEGTKEKIYLTKLATTGVIRRSGTWLNHPEGAMATFETRHVDR